MLRYHQAAHRVGPDVHRQGGNRPREGGHRRRARKNHQLFTLLKTPKRRGERSNVERLSRDVQKVVQHAANLGIKHADQ